MLTVQKSQPDRMVRLKVLRPMFLGARRLEPGDVFEVEARNADGILQTRRADFADQSQRELVYKKVEVF